MKSLCSNISDRCKLPNDHGRDKNSSWQTMEHNAYIDRFTLLHTGAHVVQRVGVRAEHFITNKNSFYLLLTPKSQTKTM